MGLVNPAEATALRSEFEALQEDYAQCLDDDRVEEWPDFFVEKGVYRIVPRENDDQGLPIAILSCEGRGMLVDRVFSMRHANIYAKHFYRHLVGRARWLGEHATGIHRFQTNYAVFRTLDQGNSEVYSVGRYLDWVVRDQGALRFVEKRVVYDNTWIDTLLVTPL